MNNSDWTLFTLGDLSENFDSMRVPVKEMDRKKGQYLYYGASGVIDMIDSYLFDGDYLLVAEDGENLRSRKTPIAFMANGKFWVNNHAHIICGNDKANSRFLMYYLSQTDISGFLTGSTIPKLTQDNLNRIPIFTPPLTEQHAIVGILSALDDKIELNRRMNRTLEAIAQVVFLEIMKDESGCMKVGTLGDDFDLTMGQSPPGNTYNEEGKGVPFFQGCTDFGFRYPDNRVYCTAPTRYAKEGDTLVSVRAPVGDVNMAKTYCAIGRGVAAIRHKSGSRSYTYYAMKSLVNDFAKFEADGTIFGSINKNDFLNLEIGIPTKEQVELFEKTCFPIDQMIENNERQSQTLANLRDILLSKLIQGEVYIRCDS